MAAKTLLFLLLSFIGIHLSAQEIVSSEPQKLSNKTPKFRVLGKNADGYVVRKYGKGYDYIDVYDARMRLRYNNKQISLKKYDGKVEDVVLNTRGATTFFTTYNKGVITLNATPLNQRYDLMDKRVILDSLILDKGESADAVKRVYSQDKKHMAYYFPLYEGNNLVKVRVIGINKNLKVLYRKTLSIGSKDNNVIIINAALSNTGDFYLAAKDKNSNEEMEGMTVIQLYSMSSTTQKDRSFSAVINKSLFEDPYMQYDNLNKQLILAGFYSLSKKKAKKASNGFFFMRYNPESFALDQEAYTDYTGDFMVELTGKEKNRQDPSLYTFKIRDLIMRADGGGVIIAESFYRDAEEVRLNSAVMNSAFSDYKVINVYHYNDIVVFSISPQSEIDWSAILRKRQLSENDNGAFSSYAMFNDRSSLKFVYMEEVFSRAPINYYELSHTGEFIRETLARQDEEDIMVIPKLGMQVSPGELIMPSFKKNNLKLVRIKF